MTNCQPSKKSIYQNTCIEAQDSSLFHGFELKFGEPTISYFPKFVDKCSNY